MSNRAHAETKAEKLVRLHEELRAYRVETLQDAARIITLLDHQVLDRPALVETRAVVIRFLNEVSENIRTAK